MRAVTITIGDEYAKLIERLATDRALSLEEFLGSALSMDVVRLLQQLERRWMPRSRWEELVRGEGCPVCRNLQTNGLVDEEGFTIADLGITRLRLMRNQFVAGYCVLACREH